MDAKIFPILLLLSTTHFHCISSRAAGKGGRRVPIPKKQDLGLDWDGIDYDDDSEGSGQPVIKEPAPDQWKGAVKSDYKRDFRPNYGVEAIRIKVSMAVIRLHSISEASMSYGLDMYFRQAWNDSRLAFDPQDFHNETQIFLPFDAKRVIWVPDTYFPNAVDEKIDETKVQIILKSDGQVWLSKRLQLTLDCPMNLVLYPFDKQACQLQIGSYASTASKITYEWMKENAVSMGKINLPEFGIEPDDHHEKEEIQVWPGGNYSVIRTCFIFERRAGFCMIQMIIPAAAVIMCCWVALWVDDDVTFSDLLAVILAIIFLAYAQNSIMPPVSYVKLMDIYLGACFGVAFLSLTKLVFLKYAKKRAAEMEAQRQEKEESPDPEADLSTNNLPYRLSQDESNKALLNGKKSSQGAKKRKEACCSVLCCVQFFHIMTQLLLPFVFFGFVIVFIFWIPNMNQADSCWKK